MAAAEALGPRHHLQCCSCCRDGCLGDPYPTAPACGLVHGTQTIFSELVTLVAKCHPNVRPMMQVETLRPCGLLAACGAMWAASCLLVAACLLVGSFLIHL